MGNPIEREMFPGWYWKAYFTVTIAASLLFLIYYSQSEGRTDFAWMYLSWFPVACFVAGWGKLAALILPELRGMFSFVKGFEKLVFWMIRINVTLFVLFGFIFSMFALASLVFDFQPV